MSLQRVMPALMGGKWRNSSFYLPLGDLGNGIVNLVPGRSAGDPTPTFTRATVAWAKLSSGLWGQVATGTARSHYLGRNTAVGAYGGFFPELAAIQLVTPTADIRDMTGAGWAATTMTVAKSATGIDGAANAATTLTATGNGATVLHVLSGAASSRTYSAFIRRVTGTGTVKLVQNTTKMADLAASLNTSTYIGVQLNANVDVTTAGYGIELGTSGDVIEVDFNQFEAGLNATSPMASAGAARNADFLLYPFAGNADATQGTAYAEVASTLAANNLQGAIVNFTASGANPTLSGQFTTASINDGTNTVNKTGLISIAGAVRKRASSWGPGGLAVAGDGLALGVAAFDGAMSNTAIGIGCGTSGLAQFNGTIKEVRLFRMQNPIQAMTA